MVRVGNRDKRMRLDVALVARGLAPSRARARDAILRGHVTVDGAVAVQPSLRVAAGSRIEAGDPAGDYVSRAALKLLAALEHFGYSPQDRIALDIGTSTGGFTEVLLRREAKRVYCVDSGHDQLHARLAGDARIVNLEKTNVRHLDQTLVLEPISAIVADVSFISLKLALPPALPLAAPHAWGIFLAKPQFEVGRAHVGKGGVVRDAAAARNAVNDLAEWIGDTGWIVDGVIASPIAGGDGNQEYLIGARHG